MQANRRQLLLGGAGAAAAAATVATGTAKADDDFDFEDGFFGASSLGRQADAFSVRVNAAELEYRATPRTVQKSNGDETRYDDYRGNFYKTLPHNDLGEVDKRAYRSLTRALKTNRANMYENIILDDTVRTRKLANPQAAYKFNLSGTDSHATRMRPAPAFASAETAGEMGEVYAKAELRDVPFRRYDWNNKVARAVEDLNKLSAPVGPTEYGRITTNTVFRGETPGDLVGPYISQFLLRDVPFGNGKIEQRYAVPTKGVDFMTNYDEWLTVQRGGVPGSLTKEGGLYIYNARALGEYVHVDFSYQAYLNAALILLGLGGGALADENPYSESKTQGGFVSLGAADILDMVGRAGNLALTGAWYHKWLVHRRLRPEAYGGRLHNQRIGKKDYGLPDEIVGSDIITRAYKRNGTYLLPMAFAEGSPTHPAYPAGHATIAGACVTVLKAFFDEEYVLENSVEANGDGTKLRAVNDRLTIGGELNKLANNISLGRDWAGVHYRSDGVDGMDVGEQMAIGLLRDYSLTYNERYDGVSLTKFDGQKIQIKNGRVRNA